MLLQFKLKFTKSLIFWVELNVNLIYRLMLQKSIDIIVANIISWWKERPKDFPFDWDVLTNSYFSHNFFSITLLTKIWKRVFYVIHLLLFGSLHFTRIPRSLPWCSILNYWVFKAITTLLLRKLPNYFVNILTWCTILFFLSFKFYTILFY